MSLDPWPASYHNPQTWNRYAYAGNNPLSVVDPTGMEGEDDEGCSSDSFENCGGNFGDQQDEGEQGQQGGSVVGNQANDGTCQNAACDSKGNCLMDCEGDKNCVVNCVDIYMIPPLIVSDPPPTDDSATQGSSEGSSQGDAIIALIDQLNQIQKELDEIKQQDAQWKKEKEEDEARSRACFADHVESAIGGAAILGDIALLGLVGPELVANIGEEGGFEAALKGGTSTLIAGVPGVILYKDGVSKSVADCK